MEWKSIQINNQNIKYDNGNAILVALPHNSKFDGFVFWHSNKLVRNGKHSNAVSISYTDEFNFNLKKYGKGKYNYKDIIDEVQIDVKEFEDAFGIMNDNITAPKKDTESYLIVEEPEKIDKEIKVLDELKNDKH